MELLKKLFILLILAFTISSCSGCGGSSGGNPVSLPEAEPALPNSFETETSIYTDSNGETAYIPAKFTVSDKTDEQNINTGLVVIGSDGSEYVWIPATKISVRDFGSFFSEGDSIANYHDETDLSDYQSMLASINQYGGFYMSRYEASQGEENLPVSKRITTTDATSHIWVHFSPQKITATCKNLYADNDTVQGFFPWGANWDTMLQWLIDSGCKQLSEINKNSTSWGNYSNDTFSVGAMGNYTGQWEEAKANNIYDLAGNNWEWTQERKGTNYVARGGGYNLMGGACRGDEYPVAVRDPLPGNDNHPNITFRVGLYLTPKAIP